MKKIGIYSMALFMLGIGTLNTGCMGSWGITKKVYGWNDGATGNKFADNLLFWVLNIIPVYSFCIFIDGVILNLIEFWTGSNPVAMKAGEREVQMVKGNDGNNYEIVATQNRFEITPMTGAEKGNATELFFTPENQTWSVNKNNETTVIAKLHPETNKAEIFAADGSVQLVDMNAMATQHVLNAAY